MKIVGCDLHARQQSVAMLDTDTGELRKLEHEGGQLRVRDLQGSNALTRVHGLVQIPFLHTRPEPCPHPNSSVQGRGQGPTAFTGADVYSMREPTPQKMSTG